MTFKYECIFFSSLLLSSPGRYLNTKAFLITKLEFQPFALYEYRPRLWGQELQKPSEADGVELGRPEEMEMPCLYYIWCLKTKQTTKHCAVKDITAGTIYKVQKAAQKYNFQEIKAGWCHCILVNNRNIPKDKLVWMEKKSNLMEKGNLFPHHLARELYIAILAPVLTGRTLESQDSGTGRAGGFKKETVIQKGDALIHLA